MKVALRHTYNRNMSGEGRLTRLIGQVRWSLHQHGLRGTLRTVASILRKGRAPAPPTHPFDLEYGTDTSGLIGSRDLRSGHPHDVHCTAYFGVPPSRLRHAVERWQQEAGVADLAGYTFFDAGCGKGRALMVASTLGFGKVAGVDLNAGLIAIAQANFEVWRKSHPDAAPAMMLQGDVTEAALPEGPLLLYIYNPFGAPVLRKLLQHLVQSRAVGGPPLHLMYLYPEEAAVFAEFASFRLLWSGAIPLDPRELGDGVSSPEDPCNLYVFTPALN